MVLNYADGEHDMVEIARRCECTLAELAPVIERLEAAELIAHIPAGRRTA